MPFLDGSPGTGSCTRYGTVSMGLGGGNKEGKERIAGGGNSGIYV